MNFLDYLTNAMTGGQPTQQELMARQMAKQGLLGDPNSVVRESEMPNYSTGNVLRESEMKRYDPNSVLRESEMRMTPQMAGRQLPPAVQMPQYTTPAGQMKPVPMPQLERQPGALPPSRMPVVPSNQMSPYMQNLTNPGMTMQQNYIDPRLIEEMYYRGLLSR
jgi:hypothetical protein